MKPVAYIILIVMILAQAAMFRLGQLDNRVMHTDEAVHAVKFKGLLERNCYTYEMCDFHGPSLNYLTLPVAKLFGAGTLAEVNEIQLRLVPAIFGILLVAMTLLLVRSLGWGASLWAAALAAVSPAMVFYSRYYIQEMLLVTFTFGAIVSFWMALANRQADAAPPKWRQRLGTIAWFLLAGACIGMMHASKETDVIALFCMAAAAGGAWLWGRKGRRPIAVLPTAAGGRYFVLGALVVMPVAVGISGMLLCSMGTNPGGLLDSVRVYGNYLGRAGGEGYSGRHLHPWYYYLQLLAWHRGGGIVWSEAAILLLAAVGLAAVIRGKGFDSNPRQLPLLRFLAIYAVLMVAAYSLIPYKTPWCLLGFLHPLILLAGVGAAALLRWMPCAWSRGAMALLLVAAMGQLIFTAWRGSFTRENNPGNPYVYSQATTDVPRVAKRILELTACAQGDRTNVQVICPPENAWPLPWYLRRLKMVDWNDQVADDLAPILLVSPDKKAALIHKLFEATQPGQRHLYVPLDYLDAGSDRAGQFEIRPNVFVLAYVRMDLWEAFDANRPPPPAGDPKGKP